MGYVRGRGSSKPPGGKRSANVRLTGLRGDDFHGTAGDSVFHHIGRGEVIDEADAIARHEEELAGDVVGLGA